jgi:type I restriction-modification system DNA methylase subunit
MSIEEQISQLIDKYKYETNKAQSEADVRANYIDLLFSYLGWDVWGEDLQHASTYHREAYVRGAGYVDVGLEIAHQPVLMLEAKRFGALTPCAERIHDRSPEERQLFRYARGKKIPYCILTNFERLHVFNADQERLILPFDNPAEYLDRLPELLRLSPERVKAGSLQAWERQLEIKDVDEAFLASLQSWRLQLANSIYQYNLSNPALQINGSLDFDKLMAAVQRILDRLILIRYADDKEVLQQYDILHTIVSYYRNLGGYSRRDHLMWELIELSHKMDEYHNTTLFQRGHLCEQVFIPNEVLASIITEMNNISFRKFTSDILGNTYETYLGTKLVLKEGEIKSEERRDIRKAGGVFYTPPIIVHYIVDNTLGCLLNELEKQHEVHAIEKAKEIKVLDPACGSGSFLIYAYQVLANFYRRVNQQIEDEQVKLLESVASPDMFKRLELVKQLPQPLLDYSHHILQKQLYGVDIDPEAAEIAAVNLTMQAFTDARQEKLPLILNENIKVGNSLISGSEQELRHYFGDKWTEKKPFNWEKEFPQILGDGRFDVVIGNPPWVSLKGKYKSLDLSEQELQYLFDKFNVNTYAPNLYEIFIWRSLGLLKEGGLFSFIVPDRLAANQQFLRLREYILSNFTIERLFFRVPFPGTIADTMVFVIRKTKPKNSSIEIRDYPSQKTTGVPQNTFLSSSDFSFFFVDPEIAKIFQKIKQNIEVKSLDTFAKSTSGCGAKSSLLHKERVNDKEIRVVKGESIGQYENKGFFWFEFSDENLTGRTRDAGKLGVKEKVLIRKTGADIIATFDDSGVYPEQSLYFLYGANRDTLLYLLALLNSKLINAYYRNFAVTNRDTTPQLKNIDLDKFPIRAPSDETRVHLARLVQKAIALNREIQTTLLHSDRWNSLKSELAETRKFIDRAVYDLYGLTEEEKQIIEVSVAELTKEVI